MKKCKVISYNKYREVLVFEYNEFEYNETEIQTHYHLDSVPEFIYVSYVNGKYEISLTKKTVEKSQKIKNKTMEVELASEVVDAGDKTK